MLLDRLSSLTYEKGNSFIFYPHLNLIINCDPPELQVGANPFCQIWRKSLHTEIYFFIQCYQSRSQWSSWTKAKPTCQLQISPFNPILFPVTPSLKIQLKARVPLPPNTDCTCHSYKFNPGMMRECLLSFLPAHTMALLRTGRRKCGCRRKMSGVCLCSSGPHYVCHCYFSIWCQQHIIVAISMVGLP